MKENLSSHLLLLEIFWFPFFLSFLDKKDFLSDFLELGAFFLFLSLDLDFLALEELEEGREGGIELLGILLESFLSLQTKKPSVL